MSDERLQDLLESIGQGDRDALQALVSETAEPLCLMLMDEGTAPGAIRAGLIRLYANLWRGEYSIALAPGDDLFGWLLRMTRANLPRKAPAMAANKVTDETLWPEVSRAAFPEHWRNLLGQTGIGVALGGAAVWAAILWVMMR